MIRRSGWERVSTIVLLLLISPSLTAANLTVSSLSDGVFLMRSERAVEGYGVVSGNGLIVKTAADKAVLIDTPWDASDVEELFNWLASQSLSLEAVVVTHSHEDAGGHLALFHQNNIPSWTYELTNQYLLEKGETPAQHTFIDSAWIVPGMIEAFYPGPGHTLDNSVVWVKQHNLLFGGCFIREQTTFSLGYTAEGDVRAWPESVSRVTEYFPEVQRVVPGHGKVGDAALLSHTRELALKMLP